LGLERDVYLSVVKFLSSSVVRRVWLNTFVLLRSFFFIVVHWN
jgi:hypothetical protein